MRRFALAIVAVTLFAAAQAPAADSFFDVFTELAVTAPPYPTQPLETRIGSRDGIRLTISGSGFRSVAAGRGGGGGGGTAGFDLPVSCVAGPPGADWSSSAFFDITYLSAVGGPDYAAVSFFDIFTELRAPDGTPGQLVPVSDAFPAGDPRNLVEVTSTESYFDVTYEVMFNPREYTVYRCRGTTAPGVRITQATAQTGLCSNGACSAFTLHVELQADDPSGCCSGAQPVVRLTETAQTYDAAVANDERTWGAVKSLFR
jgi:hypothetical protein